MQMLLKEFLSSGDITEATRCLKELDVPHFHHELIYQVKVNAGVCSLGRQTFAKGFGNDFFRAHPRFERDIFPCVFI